MDSFGYGGVPGHSAEPSGSITVEELRDDLSD
jgi:hypothetical protein